MEATPAPLLPFPALEEILIQLEFSCVCSSKSKGLAAYLLVFHVRAVQNSKLPFATFPSAG